MDSSERVAVAKILSPHGLKGEVKLRSYTENPEDFLKYAPLTFADGKACEAQLKSAGGKNQLIVILKGIGNRTAAEALKNQEIYAQADRLPILDEDEFFARELEGLTVLNSQNEILGKVIAMHHYGAGDILEIEFSDGTKEMFAFDNETFPEVNVEKGTILLIKPEIV